MDTVTQALLGGAVGYAVAGKHAPRKAMLWGAAIAVLPDLDIFIRYDDDISAITLHRSWSHSWLVQTVIAPLIALLIYRFDKSINLSTWCLLIWLALITHSGLDALTVYGTQLFWPFMPPPTSIASIFIIDPLYSLALLLGFIAIIFRPNAQTNQRVMRYGFLFSCCYLVWGLGAQYWVSHHVKTELTQQQIDSDKVHIIPSPFNTLLWRVLVIDEDHYYEGYRSVFDDSQTMQLNHYPRNLNLALSVNNTQAIQRLVWFTNDFYALDQQHNNIVAIDLRMGLEPYYVFSYDVARFNKQNDAVAITPKRISQQQQYQPVLNWVWRRIWDEQAQFSNESSAT